MAAQLARHDRQLVICLSSCATGPNPSTPHTHNSISYGASPPFGEGFCASETGRIGRMRTVRALSASLAIYAPIWWDFMGQVLRGALSAAYGRLWAVGASHG